MPQCAVATCRNSHRRTRGRRIRYHRFPQIAEVRARWVRACGRAPLANGDIPFNIQTARICSLHFTNDSYEKDMEHLVLGLPVRSRLRRGAVPTIGVPVNVQPVTKMLVEDAKRSILKVAHAKIISGERKLMDIANEEKRFFRKCEDEEMDNDGYQYKSTTFRTIEEQKMTGIDVLLALGLKPAARLNKMHSMDSATTSIGNNKGNNVRTEKAEEKVVRGSSQVPQSRQNGAALPEETATPTGRISVDRHIVSTIIKKESLMTDEEDDVPNVRKKKRIVKDGRKRRSTEEAANGNAKRICFEQRERFIDSLVGCDRISTAEELASRADELVAEVKALDELARAKEMEWNEILSMRKLKEEAYLRVERRRQVMGFLESNNGQISDSLPPASLSLVTDWEDNRQEESSSRERQHIRETSESVRHERRISRCRLDTRDEDGLSSEITKRETSDGGQNIIEKYSKKISQLSTIGNRVSAGEGNRRHARSRSSVGSAAAAAAAAVLESNLDGRQIGEGRQGPIVDVRSIIADYRLRHPEGVPRRGRRMRNSVNVGLGAGGAMVETGHGDSRPSSTDSCKSGPTNSDPMSFKDVLVQFAKLSQQQGEPVKTPQNYPDVTLHPVAPSPVTANSPVNSGQSGSLLHGILTKNQNPRPTTFSPTLARLLTAPERERSNVSCTGTNNSASGTTPIQSGQVQAAQHLLQAYQGSNSVSISDLLSSSKTRTEITITPVVNTTVQTNHSNNNIVNVDDAEGNHVLPEERDSRRTCSSSRDNREEAPPRCQGCNERAAQFVCAGCGNQWYCSRECQVSAWDEHSEVCSG